MDGHLIWSSYDGDLLADRGLFYGDGLFETILVVDGAPRLFDRHLNRLRRSALTLGIAFPEHLREAVDRGLIQAGASDAILKVVLSRQALSRGYASDRAAGSQLLLALYSREPEDEAKARKPVDVAACSTRLARQPALAGHKHLNRLEQVLARSEWSRADIAEGLMLDSEDLLIEATSSNVFLVQDGVLRTPDLTYSGVAGVMREWVIEQARSLGFVVEEAKIQLADLERANEMFLTNALTGIRPVASFLGSLPLEGAQTPVKQFSDYAFAERFSAVLNAFTTASTASKTLTTSKG